MIIVQNQTAVRYGGEKDEMLYFQSDPMPQFQSESVPKIKFTQITRIVAQTTYDTCIHLLYYRNNILTGTLIIFLSFPFLVLLYFCPYVIFFFSTSSNR